jgi:putative chitinase
MTPEKLHALAPSCQFDALAPLLSAAMASQDIDTELRVVHFLAQCAHESAGFTRFYEGLSYSAERLCQVWPGRFHNVDEAAPFARNPEKLANNVYSGRLGNLSPGDGYKYRGRGLIQITGRSAYKAIGDICGLDLINNPDLASTLEGSCKTATAFWTSKALNLLADADDLSTVTTRVNGGLTGLSDRAAWLAKAKALSPWLPLG